MQLIGAGFGDHVHVDPADRNRGRGVVGNHLKFVEGIVIRVELGKAAIRAGPIQVETIETEDLLSWCTAVHLHGGLLVALVSADVNRAHRGAGHLRDRRPGVAAAGDLLKQLLVERGGFLDVLEINDGFAFYRNRLRYFAYHDFGIHGGREAGVYHDAGLVEGAKSACCDG